MTVDHHRCCAVPYSRGRTAPDNSCRRRAVWFLGSLGFCQQHADMIDADRPYDPYPDLVVDGVIMNGGRALEAVADESWIWHEDRATAP